MVQRKSKTLGKLLRRWPIISSGHILAAKILLSKVQGDLLEEGNILRKEMDKNRGIVHRKVETVVLWVFASVHKKHQTHNHKRPSRGNKCLGNLCREKRVAW